MATLFERLHTPNSWTNLKPKELSFDELWDAWMNPSPNPQRGWPSSLIEWASVLAKLRDVDMERLPLLIGMIGKTNPHHSGPTSMPYMESSYTRTAQLMDVVYAAHGAYPSVDDILSMNGLPPETPPSTPSKWENYRQSQWKDHYNAELPEMLAHMHAHEHAHTNKDADAAYRYGHHLEKTIKRYASPERHRQHFPFDIQGLKHTVPSQVLEQLAITTALGENYSVIQKLAETGAISLATWAKAIMTKSPGSSTASDAAAQARQYLMNQEESQLQQLFQELPAFKAWFLEEARPKIGTELPTHEQNPEWDYPQWWSWLSIQVRGGIVDASNPDITRGLDTIKEHLAKKPSTYTRAMYFYRRVDNEDQSPQAVYPELDIVVNAVPDAGPIAAAILFSYLGNYSNEGPSKLMNRIQEEPLQCVQDISIAQLFPPESFHDTQSKEYVDKYKLSGELAWMPPLALLLPLFKRDAAWYHAAASVIYRCAVESKKSYAPKTLMQHWSTLQSKTANPIIADPSKVKTENATARLWGVLCDNICDKPEDPAQVLSAVGMPMSENSYTEIIQGWAAQKETAQLALTNADLLAAPSF